MNPLFFLSGLLLEYGLLGMWETITKLTHNALTRPSDVVGDGPESPKVLERRLGPVSEWPTMRPFPR